MKKFSFLAILLCMALLSSCDSDSVPGNKVRIDIRATAFDVVKNLKDTEGKLYFTGKMPEGYRIRVTCFVYRYAESMIENDVPVSVQTAFLDDVTAAAAFSAEADPGDFRVITTADLVKMSGDKVAVAYNDVTGSDRSIDVSVAFKNNGGHLNAVGTATSGRISLAGGKKTEVSLSMQPAGALITTCFYQVDAAQCKEIIYRMSGSEYKLSMEYVDDRLDQDVSDSGSEEIIKPVAGKEVYYEQRYVICNSDKVAVSWAGIGYFQSKNFAFVAGTNNFVKINIASDEVFVNDDYVN